MDRCRHSHPGAARRCRRAGQAWREGVGGARPAGSRSPDRYSSLVAVAGRARRGAGRRGRQRHSRGAPGIGAGRGGRRGMRCRPAPLPAPCPPPPTSSLRPAGMAKGPRRRPLPLPPWPAARATAARSSVPARRGCEAAAPPPSPSALAGGTRGYKESGPWATINLGSVHGRHGLLRIPPAKGRGG